MRIIKHGRDPRAGTQYKSKCRNCGTVFEWALSEGRLRPDQRDGDYYEVTCPVCSRMVTMDVPKVTYY